MAKKKEKLVIIDGHALIFRAWHALPPLKTSKGLVVNAVFGFTSTILKTIKDFKPDYFVVTLDEKGPTVRHEAYADYKATRVEQPDEFHEQLPYIKDVLKVLNIPTLSKKGYEADDIIGTIVEQEKSNAELDINIVTKDFDIFQLVNDHTTIISLEKGVSEFKEFTEKEVIKKYQLTPHQIIDFKALKGDPSDNIKGVPGIGDKTATQLIKDFGSLDELYKKYENSKKITKAVKEKLKEHKKAAYESQDLVTIIKDVDIKKTLKDFTLKPIDSQKAYDLFSELEFRTLIPRLNTLDQKEIKGKAKEEKENVKYTQPKTDAEVKKLLTTLSKQKVFAFDTETTGLDQMTARIVGLSISWKDGSAYWITKDIFEKHKKEFKKIFENKKIGKTAHNIKYDMSILENEGIDLEGVEFDTMLAAYVLTPGERNYSLKHQALIEFGHKMTEIEELIGTGKKQLSMLDVDPNKIKDYACADADFAWRLYQLLHKRVSKEKVKKVFTDLEMPLVLVLQHMERSGITVDVKEIERLTKLYTKKVESLEKNIYKLSGEEFNIASPKQLKVILFEKLEIPTDAIKSTKTGLSTAASELAKLRGLHPIIDKISEYRELSKLVNTYLEPLPKLINPETKRIHTTYNQTIAATGRLSSVNPNLQNIPIRTEFGNNIRKAFVAEKGNILVAADYSQIELRIAADLSKDPNMVEAFKNDIDIHRLTAAFINDTTSEKVTDAMRSKAKEVNFGVLYGMNAFGLSQRTDVSVSEAQYFLDRYFEEYETLREYRENLIADARDKGYAESVTGRRRYLPDLGSRNAILRHAAERMAINMPIQGTQADIIKMAMIDCYDTIVKKNHDIMMILQIHDELVFEVSEKSVKKYIPEIQKVMSKAYTLSVPLKVNIKTGYDWKDMKEIL